MNNPIFNSDTRNIYNEVITNTIPAIIGNEKVLLSQTYYRNIQESAITNAYPFPQRDFVDYPNFSINPSTVINATPAVIPGGVSFTFPNRNVSTMQPNYVNQLQGSDQVRLQYEMALKELEREMLQKMIENDQSLLKRTQLIFHFDATTSTADLPKEIKNIKELAIQTSDVEMKDISVGHEEETNDTDCKCDDENVRENVQK